MSRDDLFADLRLLRDVAAPAMVSFDVTSNCNLRCVHCFNDSGASAPNRDLPADQKLDIARQIASLRPFNVCLCGGETLCCDHLIEIMDILRPSVGTVSMVSNGYLMTPEKARELKEHGLKLVQISVDGAYAWQHDTFRGVAGSFERAVAALKNLREAGVPQRDVSLVPNALNYRSMDAYIGLCRELGVREARMMPFLPSGRGFDVGRSLMLEPAQMFRFCRDIERLKRACGPDFTIIWGDPLDHMRRMPFNAEHGLRTYVMEIKTNGDLTVSSYLPVVAGNCARHTLKEYWDAGYKMIWADRRYTRYTDQIRCIYDLETFEPRPFSGETIQIDIMEGAR